MFNRYVSHNQRVYVQHIIVQVCKWANYCVHVVSSELVSSKDTMKRNVDATLKLGESLEAMMQKSNDL